MPAPDICSCRVARRMQMGQGLNHKDLFPCRIRCLWVWRKVPASASASGTARSFLCWAFKRVVAMELIEFSERSLCHISPKLFFRIRFLSTNCVWMISVIFYRIRYALRRWNHLGLAWMVGKAPIRQNIDPIFIWTSFIVIQVPDLLLISWLSLSTVVTFLFSAGFEFCFSALPIVSGVHALRYHRSNPYSTMRGDCGP